ncbi:hypothetical protein ACD588_21875, partial [Xanthomonas campestris pv. campestris]
MTSPISTPTLAELVNAGVLGAVQLVGQVGGYTVTARVGQSERQLTTQRGEPRLFASLDTAAMQLLALGVMEFSVLPAKYERAPKVYRRSRPADIKALGKPAREVKPASKPPGSAHTAGAAKILPSDRAQLKLPGLPRSRKAVRTGAASALRPLRG